MPGACGRVPSSRKKEKENSQSEYHSFSPFLFIFIFIFCFRGNGGRRQPGLDSPAGGERRRERRRQNTFSHTKKTPKSLNSVAATASPLAVIEFSGIPFFCRGFLGGVKKFLSCRMERDAQVKQSSNFSRLLFFALSKGNRVRKLWWHFLI